MPLDTWNIIIVEKKGVKATTWRNCSMRTAIESAYRFFTRFEYIDVYDSRTKKWLFRHYFNPYQ